MNHQPVTSMKNLTSSLEGKSGDEFDEAFIAKMIVHHQGAIDMANLAKSGAKHDEVKNLADGIVTAQSKEIIQLEAWQTKWGYDKPVDTATHSDKTHSCC